MNAVSFVTNTLAVLTVAGQAALVAGIALLAVRGRSSAIIRLLSRHAMAAALIVVLVATIGSLFYSEIARYEPCKLCWFQRILMYPQAILLGLALFIRDSGIAPYVLSLSVIGGAVAAYHYLLQIGLVAPTSCQAVGYAVSCSQRFFMTFGYITIPLMAFTAFGLVSLAMTALLLSRRAAATT